MTVSIFGLGYVGVVTSACFARDGINVIGVDINPDKVKNINNAIPPIIEPGLEELLREGVHSGRIRAVNSVQEAIDNSQVSLISVGTPSREDGALDLQYVERVCDNIAEAVENKKKPHVLIIRSTVFPGTTSRIEEMTLKKYPNINLAFGFNPEFLREGAAIRDFDEAAYTIIGTDNDIAEAFVRKMYATVDSPVHVVRKEEAELIKYAANAWHATKITFSNEIGRLGKNVGIDARKVMKILVSDEKLNTSPVYMRPGFAYGGSCLPKDVRAINYYAKVNNVSLPLMNSLSESNYAQIELAIGLILKRNMSKVGLLGLSFKSGTDDLRESPAVELAERILGKGIELKILDHSVSESKLIGSNKSYIDQKIPHLSRLMVESEDELIEHSDLIVVTHGASEFRTILNKVKGDRPILDLTGIFSGTVEYSNYEGIAW
jgi:GDP-mannose 6-dehydrogenase